MEANRELAAVRHRLREARGVQSGFLLGPGWLRAAPRGDLVTGQAAERSYRKPAVSAKSREKFLQALASGWTATPAAARAGLTRQRLYELRDADEAFAGEWEAAVEAGTHVLEDEALRRAVEGYDEDTLDGDGNLIRRVRRYDSALVIVGVTRT